MIRKRQLFTGLLVAGLAASGLLLGYRSEAPSTPQQVELSRDYFFRGARLALTGSDGRAAMEIEAESAIRGLDDSTLRLERVSIRRGDPPGLSLSADSALLPREGSDLSAQGNLRVTLGPAGAWVAEADQARLHPTGSRVTLTGDVSFSRDGGTGDAPSISGQHLVLDLDNMMAHTGQPVRVRIGEVVFEADGLNARIAEETITLDSNVQAIFTP